MSVWHRILNLALYEAGWFGCVLSAAAGRPWQAAGLALAAAAIHLALARDRQAELRLLLAVGLLGFVVDSVQLSLGVFRFASGQLVAGLAPVWIIAMWLQFATTLQHCLDWLRGRYLLSAAAGLVGGPLAFWGGEKLGGVLFLSPRWRSYLILSLAWGLALPLLTGLAARWRPHAAGYRWPPHSER